MAYKMIDQDEVQHFLNQQGDKPFKVIFMKKDGTQRQMVCRMDPKGIRKSAVPVMEEDTGLWRSFRKDSVLYIGDV